MVNKPTTIGTDAYGNIYVNDSGNNYIRLINSQTQNMSTLQNGACRLYNSAG